MAMSESEATNGEMELDAAEEEKVQVSHLVPKHVREAAQTNSDYGELSEKVRQLYTTIAFGEEVGQRSQIERELKSVREKKDDIRAQIRELQTELENLEQRETRLEESMANLSSKEDKFEGALEMLESQLYDGVHIFPDHGGVAKAAGLAGATPEAVIQKLKERNPGVPDYAFQSKMHAPEDWKGCTESAARSE